MILDGRKGGEFPQGDEPRIPYDAKQQPPATADHAPALRALLRRRKVSQLAAAKLLGVDGRTVRRWLAEPSTPGYRRCPQWVPELLALRLGEGAATPRKRRRA